MPHSASKEEIYTDNLLFFLCGFIICYVLQKKPLAITIHHKNENIINPIPEEVMPRMSELEKEPDTAEDDTYKNMGQVIANVQEIFGGSDRHE